MIITLFSFSLSPAYTLCYVSFWLLWLYMCLCFLTLSSSSVPETKERAAAGSSNLDLERRFSDLRNLNTGRNKIFHVNLDDDDYDDDDYDDDDEDPYSPCYLHSGFDHDYYYNSSDEDFAFWLMIALTALCSVSKKFLVFHLTLISKTHNFVHKTCLVVSMSK